MGMSGKRNRLSAHMNANTQRPASQVQHSDAPEVSSEAWNCHCL